MSKELIKRLRSVDVSWNEIGEWCAEAAARIEELEQEIATTISLLNYTTDKGLGLRWECDALQADNARLREALVEVNTFVLRVTHWEVGVSARHGALQDAKTALAGAHKQSLAWIRNQVRDECAQILEKQDVDPSFKHRMADAIRARGDNK